MIGTRHGEKHYETLLSREEMRQRRRPPAYYRVAPDRRDLNYDAYFTDGSTKLQRHRRLQFRNTRQLGVDELAAILSGLPCVRECLAGERVYDA